MVKFKIAVKTISRDHNDNTYLMETLTNLNRAGVYISSHFAGLETHDGRGITMHQNAQKCIEIAAEGNHDYAIVIEDDIDVCDQLLESLAAWLRDHAVDRPMMYVLGANYAQINLVEKAGGTAWAYPAGGFYGAQALVWRRKDAEALAKWLGPDPDYNGIKDHGHDLKLQQWARAMGITHFIATVPCMVQHIGAKSGIGNRFFQFPWGGRDWRYAGAA